MTNYKVGKTYKIEIKGNVAAFELETEYVGPRDENILGVKGNFHAFKITKVIQGSEGMLGEEFLYNEDSRLFLRPSITLMNREGEQ